MCIWNWCPARVTPGRGVQIRIAGTLGCGSGKKKIDSRTLEDVKEAEHDICLDVGMRERDFSHERLAHLEYLICKGSGRE